MLPSFFLPRSILSRFGMTDEIYGYWETFQGLGRSTRETFPKVLLQAALLHFFRGLNNKMIFSVESDWLWPYWVNEQFNPLSKSFSPHSLSIYVTNITHRNWTAIGCLNSTQEAVIDPRGLVTPLLEGWSVEVGVALDEKVYYLARLDKVEQTVAGDWPCLRTSFDVEGLACTRETFAGWIKKTEVIFDRLTVKNNAAGPANVEILFSVRPYNPEGVSLVREIEYSPLGGVWLGGRLGLVLEESPQIIDVANYGEGDVLNRRPWKKRHVKNHCQMGLASAVFGYRKTLEPGQEESWEVRELISERHGVSAISQVQREDHDQALARTAKAWEEILGRSLKLKLPFRRLQEAFDINKAYLLLLFDGTEIMPGPMSYHHFWIRDAAYLLQALEILGYQDLARQILATYPSRQREDGFFKAEEGEWDGAGQAIWSLVQHYRYSQDKDFLAETYPTIFRAAKWVEKNRVVGLDPDEPAYGLLPPGLSAEHFGLADYYFWDDFWGVEGAREALYAAQVLPRSGDIKFLAKLAWEFAGDLDRGIDKAWQKIGRPAIPAAPGRHLDSAAIGSLVGVYPLRAMSPFDPRLVNTLDHLEKNCFVDGSFFHKIMHSGHATYLTTHILQCYLRQAAAAGGEVRRKVIDKFWKVLNWLIAHASPTYTWPEAINTLTGGGCMGDGHHGWMVADLLTLTRNLCFYENGDELIILPLLDETWFSQEVAVANGVTFFGKISFSLKAAKVERPTAYGARSWHLKLRFLGDFHHAPARISLILPGRVEQVIKGGDQVVSEGEKISFSAQTNDLEFVVKI